MARHKDTETGEKSYLGNSKIPAPGSRYEYTPEMVAEIKKCKKHLLHFAENHFYIVNVDEGRQQIKLRKYQKRLLKSLKNNRFVVLLASRQIGKSSVLTIYMLWIALFNDDQNILLVANKEATAKEIFKRIKLAYEMLPNYLKSPVVKYAETSMSLTNGSSISISTTTSDTGRGSSVSLLCLDELAFIEPNLLDTFWASVYPVISSSKKAKILAVSTPNGVGNLFHSLYTNALKKGEEWNGWHAERVDWWEIPDRDEDWKERTIQTMGSRDKFAQEFECVFLSSGESALDEGLYENMRLNIIDPKYVYEEGNYLIWEQPSNDKLYSVGVDIGEGLNQNASVAQILDITDLSNIKQVGQYYSKDQPPYVFTQKLYEVLTHWGKPAVSIERNNCGAQVVDAMRNTFGYENIVSWGAKILKEDKTAYQRTGIISHTATKYRAVMNMRYWLNELRVVNIVDTKTLNELHDFIRHANSTWSGRTANTLDDRVMSLVWALIILENDLCPRYFEVIKYDDNMRPEAIKSLDYGFKTIVNPIGLYNNEVDNMVSNPLPIIFQQDDDIPQEYFDNADVGELYKQGWRMPEDINNLYR
jgi:hypothetical protein